MSDVSERVELLPCPFCGGEARVRQSRLAANLYRAECINCDAGPGSVLGEDRAIAAWNRRSSTLAANRVEGMKDAPEAAALKWNGSEARSQSGNLYSVCRLSDAVWQLRWNGTDLPGWYSSREKAQEAAQEHAILPEPKPAAVLDDAMVEAAARAIAGTAWEGIYFTTRSREQYMDDCWREHETDARTALTAALRAVQPSIAGEAIPRSEWGCELWEILFGLLKGAVPDELTDEVLQRLAEDFVSAISSKDNGDGK